MTAQEKLTLKNSQQKFICVGLDTDVSKIPAHLQTKSNPVFEFNKAIIENTAEHAAAYKLNFAFYEKDGASGFQNILSTISLIPDDLLIIADAKRGDIGNTSKMYSDAVYDYFNFDSITLHPYMGSDSVLPFLERKDKLNFILTLTSNPGSNDFEKLKLSNGSYLYQQVIKQVKVWNNNQNCGIVFGATNSNELIENISSFENLPVLLPGIGAQGGSLHNVVKAFKSNRRTNYIINSSRGIIYKDNSENYAVSAAEEIISLNQQIKNIIDE